ncbi:MAG: tetratricopeptide repeat protein [Myxococcota bacterium]
MFKYTLFFLFLCPLSGIHTGCFATISELREEKAARRAVEERLALFKREVRRKLALYESSRRQEIPKLRAEIARARMQLALVRKANRNLSTVVKRGQGGVEEMFSTLQSLQQKFQTSLKQIEELQRQNQEILQKQPNQDKFFQELRLKYEALLKNQKALAELAVPAKLFARGRDAYKARSYGRALQIFQTFVSRFGNHGLADNAYLYIGDVYRKKGQTNPAINAYNAILRKYPAGSEVPRALYRLGLIHYRRGLCRVGRKYFRRLTRFARQEPALARDARRFNRGWRRYCKRSRR